VTSVHSDHDDEGVHGPKIPTTLSPSDLGTLKVGIWLRGPRRSPLRGCLYRGAVGQSLRLAVWDQVLVKTDCLEQPSLVKTKQHSSLFHLSLIAFLRDIAFPLLPCAQHLQMSHLLAQHLFRLRRQTG
jgi:hypothetical protein